MLAPLRKLADWERHRRLGDDPELLAKATPDYEIGCKRVLFTSDWYPTLRRDEVELVTAGIERVGTDSILAADGVEREADAIIYGTGFQTHNFVAPMDVHGLDGRELNAFWAERPEAYLGTTVSGFPNMFVLYGPNTNHGSGSVPYTLESQFNYIVDAVRRACATATGAGSTCGPRPRRRGGTRSPSAASTPSGRPVAARAGT